jgi:hypothetical protein
MTNKSALLELASRCEAATGPDRKLDLELELLLDPDRLAFMDKRFAELKASCEAQGMWPEREEACRRDAYHPTRFTDSLDAAMRLVPNGFVFSVTDAARSRANVWRPSPLRSIPPAYVKAATPALALCAAALQARAS